MRLVGNCNQPDLIMTLDSRAKSRLLIGLTLSIVLDTALQLVWKEASGGLPPLGEWQAFAAAVSGRPLFLVIALIFVMQLMVWLKVLDHADLSFAQPITALSYITVCGLSVALFGETLDMRKVAGIALILFGIWLISRGPAKGPNGALGQEAGREAAP